MKIQKTFKNITEGLHTTDDAKNSGVTLNSKTVEINHEWVLEEINKAKQEVLRNAKEEINKQVQIDKASLVTVFGIFASIISFLTIEFQFLKNICSFEKILGFTLILFCLLMSFNIGLGSLIKSAINESAINKKSSSKSKWYFGIIVLFIMGVFFTFYGNEQFCERNLIYQRYSDEFDRRFYSRDKEINKTLEGQEERIRGIESQLKSY